MHIYNIYGIVHPERALLSLGSINLHSSIGDIYFNVLNNQLYIQLKSKDYNTDLLTLRNILKDIIQEEISFISYIYGNGYDVEIIRISNIEDGIDEVFGIDIQCIAKRNELKISKINEEINNIHFLLNKNNEYSSYLRRCFSELNKAIRFPIDTGFHCFRAIESLRHFCGKKFGINELNYPKTKGDKENYLEILEWKKLQELTSVEKVLIDSWKKDYAFNARHGNHISISGEQREKIFLNTWDIVDIFLENLSKLN